jgi:hypothetical protein
MICYYYLVFSCPPGYVSALKETSLKMRTRLAGMAGCTPDELSELVVPEAARRMAAFQQATREPQTEVVEALTRYLKSADNSPEEASAYQRIMYQIVVHPGRAKPANRLHRNRGCAYCTSPCFYGFFSLVSEPDFKTLQEMLDEENQKQEQERNGVNVLWSYTRKQIWQVLETHDGIISPEHLGNLSYCLLLLGIAKSRFPLPEVQLKHFQAMNEEKIRRLRNTAIRLA